MDQQHLSVAAADQMIRDGQLSPGELMASLGVPAATDPTADVELKPCENCGWNHAVELADKKLPSGKSYVLRKGYGRDLKLAQKIAGDDGDDVTFALIAILVKIDGEELDLDAALDLDLPDVMALNEAITGKASKTPGKLPSGKSYAIKKGKGRDLKKAQRLANEPNEVGFGLVSVLATIDGEELHVDQVLDLELPDVMQLMGEVTGKVPIQAPSASPS